MSNKDHTEAEIKDLAVIAAMGLETMNRGDVLRELIMDDKYPWRENARAIIQQMYENDNPPSIYDVASQLIISNQDFAETLVAEARRVRIGQRAISPAAIAAKREERNADFGMNGY